MRIKEILEKNPMEEYKEKTATRNAYGNFLARVGGYEKIFVLDADLSESLQTSGFKKKYPKRYLDVGIAESTMAGFAAGLASQGYIPFINTFAIFQSTVAYTAIYQSIAKTKMNVKIIGSHGGIHTGEDGDSHQAINDIAVMRSTPNMLVFEFSDAVQTEKALEKIVQHEGPAYVRLHRNKFPVVYDNSFEFEIGKGYQLREGDEATIFASGVMVHKALEVANVLQGIRVVDMPSIKPIDEGVIIKAAKETERIIVMQDHYYVGGLSDAIAKVIAENNLDIGFCEISLKRFAESGSPEDLFKKYYL